MNTNKNSWSKYILFGVLGALVVPMFMKTYRGGSSFIVNGQEVSEKDIQRISVLAYQEKNLPTNYGKLFFILNEEAKHFTDPFFKSFGISFFECFGLNVSEKLTSKYIDHFSLFLSKEGKFDPETYLQVLKAMGITESVMESNIHNLLSVRNLHILPTLIKNKLVNKNKEVYYQKSIQRAFSQIRFGTYRLIKSKTDKESDYKPEINAINDYYIAHRNNFKNPTEKLFHVIKLANISAKDQKRVSQMLRNGEGLSDILKAFPDAEFGIVNIAGDRFNVTSTIPDKLKQSLYKVPAGETYKNKVDGIINGYDWYIYEMKSFTHESYKDIEDVREQISQILINNNKIQELKKKYKAGKATLLDAEKVKIDLSMVLPQEMNPNTQNTASPIEKEIGKALFTIGSKNKNEKRLVVFNDELYEVSLDKIEYTKQDNDENKDMKNMIEHSILNLMIDELARFYEYKENR